MPTPRQAGAPAVILLIADFDDADCAELAAALKDRRSRLRQVYRAQRPNLQALERACAQRVREGHVGPIPARGASSPDDAPMRMGLTIEEAADALACSASTVKRAIASGDLVTFTIGSARRVYVADLEAYIESRRGPMRPPPPMGPRLVPAGGDAA